MSKRLRNSLRSTETVTRLSGDEFVLFMEGLLDKNDIEKVAIHIMKHFELPFEIESLSLAVSCSIDISLYPKDSSDADELLDMADQTLYKVKHVGKANFAFFSD